MVERKTVSRSTRFEIFKRDCFKCQYCGSEAPNVVLEVDHIKPVAEGGDSDITNLVTSCYDCNHGKGARELSDDATVKRRRVQLEELQERREQLEMMMEWAVSLHDIQTDAVKRLAEYWDSMTPGWSVSEDGKNTIRSWLKTFSVAEIVTAMDTARYQYLRFGPDGSVAGESWSLAFAKIKGICRVSRAESKEPGIRDLYYVRGILRNRIRGGFSEWGCLELLRSARAAGLPIEHIRSIAHSVSSWYDLERGIQDGIESRGKVKH
jgi:hypothetical protein